MTPPIAFVIFNCPDCGGEVRRRRRSYDQRAFLGCSHYPKCRWTAPEYAEATALAQRVTVLEQENRELRSRLTTKGAA